MKNIVKILFLFVVIIITVFSIVLLSNDIGEQNISYGASSNSSDIQLMARAINGEARGEPYEGQVAVGAVILNRVKSSKFPNTIAGVIYQSGAFTAVADGQVTFATNHFSTYVLVEVNAMTSPKTADVMVGLYAVAALTGTVVAARKVRKNK